jgi:hypothetical protein
VVELLIMNGGADMNAIDASGSVALHLAAQNGHDTVVQLLVDKGAHMVDASGFTALHLASKNRHESMMSLLLVRRAGLNLDRIPSSIKTGGDWYVIFDPVVPRTLDVDLVRTLSSIAPLSPLPYEVHASCSIAFSQDGKYIATIYGDLVQIYDVFASGTPTIISDEPFNGFYGFSSPSICFSHDGRYLAATAGGREVKVSVPGLPQDEILLRLPGLGYLV